MERLIHKYLVCHVDWLYMNSKERRAGVFTLYSLGKECQLKKMFINCSATGRNLIGTHDAKQGFA